MRYCELIDGEEGLSAALFALPVLQRLDVRDGGTSHLSEVVADSLAELTNLQELYLNECDEISISASMLGSLHQLTRLQLSGGGHRGGKSVLFEPNSLAGKTRLRHLDTCIYCSIPSGPAGVQQLLHHLQQLQQLTFLGLAGTLQATVPPAAYAALTASSKLPHLDVRGSVLPAAAWQHLFRADRQLPDLQELIVDAWREVDVTSRRESAAYDGSLLVRACPALTYLSLTDRLYTTKLLAPLTGLSSLHRRRFRPGDQSAEGLEVVCQLTGLRWLSIAECAGVQLEAARTTGCSCS
jgi:Leucine-rich repeat (LRR) protein